eukprot:6183249-Pleurochrysis_carterae.AAC.1
MPSLRLLLCTAFGNCMMMGRRQMPSSSCSLQSTVLLRSMERVGIKFPSRTVRVAFGVKTRHEICDTNLTVRYISPAGRRKGYGARLAARR